MVDKKGALLALVFFFTFGRSFADVQNLVSQYPEFDAELVSEYFFNIQRGLESFAALSDSVEQGLTLAPADLPLGTWEQREILLPNSVIMLRNEIYKLKLRADYLAVLLLMNDPSSSASEIDAAQAEFKKSKSMLERVQSEYQLIE